MRVVAQTPERQNVSARGVHRRSKEATGPRWIGVDCAAVMRHVEPSGTDVDGLIHDDVAFRRRRIDSLVNRSACSYAHVPDIQTIRAIVAISGIAPIRNRRRLGSQLRRDI